MTEILDPRQTEGEPAVLLCPCGFDHTHAVEKPNSWDSADPQKDNPGRWSHSIDFQCENGHYFTLTLEQHKGQTLVTTEITGEWGIDRGDPVAEVGTDEPW